MFLLISTPRQSRLLIQFVPVLFIRN